MRSSDSLFLSELNVSSLRHVLREWRRDAAGCGVVALLPEAGRDDLPVLQRVCQEEGVALCGAIFPALIRPEGFVCHGLWLLRLKRMPPLFLLSMQGLDEAGACASLNDAAARALEAASADDDGQATLFLILDAMLAHTRALLEGVYETLAEQVQYVGVVAGSETFQSMPCVFDGERVVNEGVLGILLRDHPGAVLEHGFNAPEKAMIATQTQANQIISINRRPAMEVYGEFLRNEFDIEINRDNFYQYAVRFPFGVMQASDEMLVRIPVAIHADDVIVCVGEVPSHAILVVLRAPETADDDCIERISHGLKLSGSGEMPATLLTFYCAGRRLQLGARANEELAMLQRGTAAEVMPGALSLGEVGSTRDLGYPYFHNATLVCLPWKS